MASLYDFGFNPTTMYIDETGQIRLKDPEAARAMLAANEPNFDLSNYQMSTFPVTNILNRNKTTDAPIFSNPGLPELEPSFAGLNTDAAVPDTKGFSLRSLIPFAEGSMSRNILEGIASLAPKMDPRQVALRNLYGYTSTGSVPSGLMKGYNPVSGGGLYTLTGGKFGEPPTYGLQKAYDKRRATIEKTLTSDRYGLDQDDIDAIYAGTFDKEVLNPSTNLPTSLVQRLRDLKAMQDKELKELQSVTPGSTNDGFITFDGGSGGGSIPANVTAAGGSYDGGYQAQEGGFEFTGDQPGTSDQGYTDSGQYAGLKRGGLAKILEI